MKVDLAVIPAAGRGTRMQPATRSVPKALLPVVDRPVIQWIVEEGMRAGVEEFIIVVSPGVDDLVYSHFEGMGGLDLLDGFHRITLTWVVQEEALGLGHAVLTAAKAVDDRPFFCLLGDNLVVPDQDHLSSLAAASDGRSVVCLRPLDDEGLERYGVVIPGEELADRTIEVKGAIEKPGADAPSRLGLVGRYMFTAEIFEHLKRLPPGLGGEIQLTDAIGTLGEAGRCLGWLADNDLLDVGTPASYAETVTRLALWHPEVGAGYREYLKGLFGVS